MRKEASQLHTRGESSDPKAALGRRSSGFRPVRPISSATDSILCMAEAVF